MYAIVETGGKQYRLTKNDILQIEKLKSAAPGKQVKLDKVLFYVDGKKVEIGRPYIKNAKVTCDVIGNVKGTKSISYKYKRRKGMRKKIGHRQLLTKIKVKEISLS